MTPMSSDELKTRIVELLATGCPLAVRKLRAAGLKVGDSRICAALDELAQEHKVPPRRRYGIPPPPPPVKSTVHSSKGLTRRMVQLYGRARLRRQFGRHMS
jgi:hypothetical protein